MIQPLFVLALASLIELGLTDHGTTLVADPAASKGEAVAVQLGESNLWNLAESPLPPGLYRFSIALRMMLPKDYDSSRLVVKLKLTHRDRVLVDLPVDWTHVDGRPGAYTVLTREFSTTEPVKPVLTFEQTIKPVGKGQKPRPVQPGKKPTLDEELPVEKLPAHSAVTLASITDPVVLLDKVELQPVTDSLVIERVFPEKVHVYPGGEANPVTVTIRNFNPQPATATVRLTMQTGLNEDSAPQEQSITVPGAGTATCRFDWKSGAREYGVGAKAELLLAGKPVHTLTDYFSVSTPIWKTSLQGSGFLTWAGREKDLPEHVESNRKNYINVEEAFSWQPSSWTDLNPTNELWFSGQCDFHNSRSGLDLWIGLSHNNGIKMITYNWPTCSGAVGFEWVRRNPWLSSRNAIGMGKNYDVEDFRLWDITSSRPEFWRLRQATWHYVWVNLGMLRAIETVVAEIIQSAKTFGWDGTRFDYPPDGWGAWDAADEREQFAEMGVTNLMAQLLPEYYGIKTGQWSGVATSIRNIRYIQHRFFTERGTNFAISYNFGLPEKDLVNGVVPSNNLMFAECCKHGGQIMDEAIRNSRSWKGYREQALKQAGAARMCGGFHECFPAEAASFRAYSAIFTFAAGSHPYTDYGWGKSMPGAYTAFMTRYGEYTWDNGFQPIPPDDFTIDEKILWKPYLRARKNQTVLQLISPPLDDNCAPNPGVSTPWITGLTVHKRGTAPPTVWRLSAEPVVQCEKLEARREGDGYTVTIPEHRLWTVLVWEEAQ